MQKLISVIISVLSLQFLNWYFKPRTDHLQPEVFGNSDMPAKYGSLYIGSPDEKVVYLTFDAGYENGNVEKIVNILDDHNVKGAFFILPEMVKNHSELLIRMASNGHTIANHSWSHRNMAKVTNYDDFLAELTKLENLYKETTGLEMSRYFRPPEGAFSEQMLSFCEKAGYIPVFWSFAYADWDNSAQKDVEWAYNKIMSSVHNGMVMLLHPTSATNAAVLDRVLTSLEEQGYRFGTLDELYMYNRFAETMSQQEIDKYKEDGMIFAENPSAGKKLALTFDDGPHPVYTEQVLDILKKYGIKATFFVIGQNVTQNPSLVKRAIEEGHEIGNHTYSHLLLNKTDIKTYITDYEKTEKLLEDEFNYHAKLFRPPGGQLSDEAVEQINAKNSHYVLWAWRMDTKDWSNPPTEKIVKTVTDNVHGGDIILFHDYNSTAHSHTPESLEILIPRLLEEGYEFVTVSELFGVE